jgi:Zn-dependent protease with chaperone function
LRRKLITLIAALSLGLPAVAEHKELKPGWNLFSKEQDVQLGREAAAQVESQMPIVRDGDVNGYVQKIGQRLAAQPQADKYPYSFKVVADKSINAFALPGGPTFVHTGLIAAADNEAQLAGVMAHEIAHVALRHGTNQASKANLIQLPAMLAGALIGDSGSMVGQLAQLGIGLGANSVLMKYSRDAERQADLLGAQMMAQAGYNPIEMARFFEKLQAQGGSGVPQFLSSHPNPGNRMQAIQEEIRTLPQRNYSLGDASQLQRIKGQLGSVSATRSNNADRAGGDPSGARPSGRMRELSTGAYSMVYPENWQAFGEQGASSVTLAPREGIVQSRGGGAAIGYGALVNLYQPRDGQRLNLQHHTHDLVNQLQASNPGMRVEGDSRRIRVGSQNGLVTTLRSDSPFRGGEVDLLVTTIRPEGLFYIVFIAPDSEFQQAEPVFNQMLRSVRFRS